MTRTEMVDRLLNAHPELGTWDRASEVLTCVVGLVVAGLQEDPDPKERTQRVRGLGVFTAKVSTERAGRNPRTGAPITIAPRVRITFRAWEGVAESIDLPLPTPSQKRAKSPKPTAKPPIKRRNAVAGDAASMR